LNKNKKRRQRQIDRRKAAAAKIKAQTKGTDNNGPQVVVEPPKIEENLTPEEVYTRAKSSSITNVYEIKKIMINFKRALAKSTTLEQIIIIAKAIRELVPHMNTARDHMNPIPKPQPPNFFGNESKLQMLKKTTAVAIRECESVLDGINQVVNMNATQEKMVIMRDVLNTTFNILKNYENEIPPELRENV